MMNGPGRTSTVTSYGIWHKKHDLISIFPNDRIISPLHGALFGADNYIGWGHRPGGLRAIEKARRHNVTHTLLEDGFIRSFYPGEKEPSASYIIDNQGIYFDSKSPSSLEIAINNGVFSQDTLDRANSAIGELRRCGLSKYNNALTLSPKSLGIPAGKPYVLLIDQVPGDASISGAMADASTFEKMLLEAAQRWPSSTLVIRAHPAATREGYLEAAARKHGLGLIIKHRANLWPLLEEADHVMTVSSHAGFEALMAQKPVTVFGMAYYAGWGITHDKLHCERRTQKRQLAEIFAAAYINSSIYLDVHTRKPTSLENSIDAMHCICTSRRRNRSTVVTVGMSSWKRAAVEPFLMSSNGPPIHVRTMKSALKKIPADKSADIVLWGADATLQDCPDAWRVIRMEDGFIRSVGLGASFRFPNSLVRDPSRHLYFDARGTGRITHLMNELQSQNGLKDHAALTSRAQKLRKQIVDLNITKYMLAKDNGRLPTAKLPDTMDRLKVLVIGQVEADASIRYGSPEIKTNTDFLERVRELFPDAYIAYREHPDVTNGLRTGKADRTKADLNADNFDITNLLTWCDRVETMTSLTGFEALLRDKPVGVHGWPFYAGWGLTDDRLARERKSTATLDELIAVSLILYPDYTHPVSRLPSTPEAAINALAQAPKPTFFLRRIVYPAGYLLGRVKIMLSIFKSR
jgi:capsular polysaccharide export protein